MLINEEEKIIQSVTWKSNLKVVLIEKKVKAKKINSSQIKRLQIKRKKAKKILEKIKLKNNKLIIREN